MARFLLVTSRIGFHQSHLDYPSDSQQWRTQLVCLFWDWLLLFGEHDETDLAREIESVERDISKNEQQSSDPISDAMEHRIFCGGKAHQGYWNNISIWVSAGWPRTGHCVTRLSTTTGRTERGQTRTQCQSMQCTSTSVRNGKAAEAAHGHSKAKAVRAANGRPRREARRRYTRRRSAERWRRISLQANVTRAASQFAHGDRRCAAFLASELCTECGCFHGELQETVLVFPSPVESQAPQQAETWFINMIGPAKWTHMSVRLDGAWYAVLDSGSGLTSCPFNCADDLPLLPRPKNLPTSSNVTGGTVECTGLGQVWVSPWEWWTICCHVACRERDELDHLHWVSTNANIEVRHAKNETSRSWIDQRPAQAWSYTSSRKCLGRSCVEMTLWWTASRGSWFSARDQWQLINSTQRKRETNTPDEVRNTRNRWDEGES